MTPRRRFLATLLGHLALAVVVTAVLSPPDPFTQLLYLGVLTLLSLPLSYWLTYHEGFERLR